MIDPAILKKVKNIQLKTDRLVSEALAGSYASAFKGTGIEFDEIREYVPGDDVRNIDWNVTARTGQPHVKKFVEERELTVMLLIDLSGSQRFGSTGSLKAELAAEISALLAFLANANNDRVGLIVFSETVERYIPPRKGRRHALWIIREILSFQPRGRGTDIQAALELLNKVTRHSAVVFLVSDFLDEGFNRSLRASARRHDLVAVAVTDPRESRLPPVGLIQLRDAETGSLATIDTASPRVRATFARLARERAAARDRLLRSSGVEALFVSTGQSYLDAIKRFLLRRERRLRYAGRGGTRRRAGGG